MYVDSTLMSNLDKKKLEYTYIFRKFNILKRY